MSINIDVAGLAFSTRDIGDLIRNERKALGLSQQDLADRVGCSRVTINGLEKGQNTSVQTVFGVLAALGKGLRLVNAQADVDRLREIFGDDDEDNESEAPPGGDAPR